MLPLPPFFCVSSRLLNCSVSISLLSFSTTLGVAVSFVASFAVSLVASGTMGLSFAAAALFLSACLSAFFAG
jgi:hypothetical protein